MTDRRTIRAVSRPLPVAGIGGFALALAAFVAATDCGGAPRPAPGDRAVAARVTSNSVRGDYAGSEACRGCHAAIFDKWRDSPMHRMTRSLPTDVAGRFDGSTIQVGGDRATVEEQEGARIVRVRHASGAEQRFRVTRVIGGRTREDYAGVEIGGPNAAGGREVVLPVSYVRFAGAWRYKGYSVLVHERPEIADGPIWSESCLGCHNTYPQLLGVLDDLAGPDAPIFQGSISDRLLPEDKKSVATIRSDALLRRQVTDELELLGVRDAKLDSLPTADLLGRAIRYVDKRFGGSQLVEEGVGCEACHGGSRAHVDDPSILPARGLINPALSLGRAGGAAFTDAETRNRICARCHTVLFSKYPYTWEGGGRRDPVPGGSTINSGEARDFILGHCAREMTCTACHDPHGQDDKARLARFDTVEENGVCTRCHDRYRGEGALAAHTHHDPKGPGAACLACHMPKKNMGLSYELTRYHRIGSPTDDERALADRPLECALCHTEASTEALAARMADWWGHPIDRAKLEGLYGPELSRSNLTVTLERGKPHEQAAAIGALGARGAPGELCAVAAQMAHPYPLVRLFAQHATLTLLARTLTLGARASSEALLLQVSKLCDR